MILFVSIDGGEKFEYTRSSHESAPVLVDLAVGSIVLGQWSAAHIEYPIFGHVYWDSENGYEVQHHYMGEARPSNWWQDTKGIWHEEVEKTWHD